MGFFDKVDPKLIHAREAQAREEEQGRRSAAAQQVASKRAQYADFCSRDVPELLRDFTAKASQVCPPWKPNYAGTRPVWLLYALAYGGGHRFGFYIDARGRAYQVDEALTESGLFAKRYVHRLVPMSHRQVCGLLAFGLAARRNTAEPNMADLDGFDRERRVREAADIMSECLANQGMPTYP